MCLIVCCVFFCPSIFVLCLSNQLYNNVLAGEASSQWTGRSKTSYYSARPLVCVCVCVCVCLCVCALSRVRACVRAERSKSGELRVLGRFYSIKEMVVMARHRYARFVMMKIIAAVPRL